MSFLRTNSALIGLVGTPWLLDKLKNDYMLKEEALAKVKAQYDAHIAIQVEAHALPQQKGLFYFQLEFRRCLNHR